MLGVVVNEYQVKVRRNRHFPAAELAACNDGQPTSLNRAVPR